MKRKPAPCRPQDSSANAPAALKLVVKPATAARWQDLELLFGNRGACAGCWCMWWRLSRKQWTTQKGAGNRRALRELVMSGPPPGLIAYAAKQPVGWCALAPRAEYVRLAGSRVLKPVDDQPVWSLTCFFVAKEFRRRGISVRLIEAAADFARRHGAHILEAYPTETSESQPDVFVYTGLASAFRQAGFKEILRRSRTRPILRRVLKPTNSRPVRS